MDDTVKVSIKSRIEAIYNAYDINNDDVKNKIVDFNMKMDDLGYSCKDSADFEAKFAASPLCQEYTDLFAFVAANCPCKLVPVEDDPNAKSNGEVIAENAASDLKYMADDLTSPMRHQAYQATYDAARDVPVLGEVMTAKQHFDFFSRFKKKKNKDEEEKGE